MRVISLRRAVAVVIGFVLIACLPFAVRAYVWATETIAYAEAGRVACATSFNVDYFARCNPTADGIACMHASRTRLGNYHEAVSYACDSIGPQEPFVVRWATDVQVAEAG